MHSCVHVDFNTIEIMERFFVLLFFGFVTSLVVLPPKEFLKFLRNISKAKKVRGKQAKYYLKHPIIVCSL